MKNEIVVIKFVCLTRVMLTAENQLEIGWEFDDSYVIFVYTAHSKILHDFCVKIGCATTCVYQLGASNCVTAIITAITCLWCVRVEFASPQSNSASDEQSQ